MMKEFNDFEEVVEESAVESEPKETIFDKAKNLAARGYQSVKDYVEDNPENVMVGVYVGAMGIMFGQLCRYLHICNKTAEFEYNMKVLNNIRKL